VREVVYLPRQLGQARLHDPLLRLPQSDLGVPLLMSEYLTIEKNEGLSRGRKTGIYDVCSSRSGDVLGTIQWFGRWRQYTFWPVHGTTYNPECLRYIADTCARLSREHREAKAVA